MVDCYRSKGAAVVGRSSTIVRKNEDLTWADWPCALGECRTPPPDIKPGFVIDQHVPKIDSDRLTREANCPLDQPEIGTPRMRDYDNVAAGKGTPCPSGEETIAVL